VSHAERPVIQVEWPTETGELLALEPSLQEVLVYSEKLAAGYNDPANAELMGHATLISAAEVVDSYRDSIAAGMRAFLLFVDGEFAGDGDLRNLRGTAAEFAFMIAVPRAQGKGLGTRFALMIHAFGFETLGLQRIYASVVPHNVASRRVFEKLGYVQDDSPEGRAYAEEPGDVTLMLDRETFVSRHTAQLAQIRIGVR
jgi:RimJ/RimL family protein N-acetyltransferase